MLEHQRHLSVPLGIGEAAGWHHTADLALNTRVKALLDPPHSSLRPHGELVQVLALLGLQFPPQPPEGTPPLPETSQ